jgi:hypothetical protein
MIGHIRAAQLTNVKDWTKSSDSGAAGHCVEVAPFGDGYALRNSNTPEAGALGFTGPEMAAFVSGAKKGDFDHLLG